jgi:hypothetical protein
MMRLTQVVTDCRPYHTAIGETEAGIYTPIPCDFRLGANAREVLGRHTGADRDIRGGVPVLCSTLINSGGHIDENAIGIPRSGIDAAILRQRGLLADRCRGGWRGDGCCHCRRPNLDGHGKKPEVQKSKPSLECSLRMGSLSEFGTRRPD